MEPTSWLKAKDVMFEALARPADQREAFVRERCADPAVCAEILEVLATTGGMSQEPLSGGPFPEPQRRADSPPDSVLDVGTSVGPYVIVDHIGHGGMGQVFLGTDPRLQRRVALKCLLDSRAGADVRSRIIHEARAAARISNQHVAVVHDVIEHGSRAFIVMEYVEGETLAARIRKGPLPVLDAIAFGRQIAAALAAAHAEGIIHRDLKPGNVQVTPSGLVKILDFGIASATRLLYPAATASATTRADVDTAPNLARRDAGTPPYMSPEHLLGRQIDERSDIYSLGAVLFEMCTGHRPYPGKNAVEIALAQAKGTPRADAIDRRVPRALADLIARAMAIDPDERFASAADIDAALEGLERAVADDPAARRARLIRRIARLAVGAVTVIAAVWSIGFITTLFFNSVFGREGQFARFGSEPWLSYLSWGVLALFPVAFVMVLATIVAMAIRFVVDLAGLIGPVGRAVSRVRLEARRLAHLTGLDRSSPLAQALTGVAIATLVLFLWRYADLIRAWSSFFNSAPIEALLPMTDSAPARTRYHIELSVMALAFGYGWYRVLALRRRECARDGRVPVAVLAIVVAIMMLLNEAPYRAFNRRDFERVDLAGARCYITGETAVEFLVLCPAAPPPRNRAVRRDDARLRRLGVIENVFKGIDPGRVRR